MLLLFFLTLTELHALYSIVNLQAIRRDFDWQRGNWPFILFLSHFLFWTVCENGDFLWQGKCGTSCPESTHAINRTELAGIVSTCAQCHYSCLTCSGPSDSECVTCHADSQLRTIPSSGKWQNYLWISFPKELKFIDTCWFSRIQGRGGTVLSSSRTGRFIGRLRAVVSWRRDGAGLQLGHRYVLGLLPGLQEKAGWIIVLL